MVDTHPERMNVWLDNHQPPELPTIPGVTFAGCCWPAGGHDAVGGTVLPGGDFYDVFPNGSGATFALGDVCGKGAVAAALSGRVRQSLNALRLVERRPLRLLELLNQALLASPDEADRSHFTTIMVGALTPAGDGMRVAIAGGGHPAPLVARATGGVAPIRVGGMPIGAFPDAVYQEIHLRLAPGDVLVLYSDGIPEARGGPGQPDLFGEERLREVLRSGAGLPADAVVNRLRHAVGEWLGGNPRDDITLLAIAVPTASNKPDGPLAGRHRIRRSARTA
ncbi:MAG TPA: PP2C family protein-serine/threonine phosphatase [Pilimelia sp.]|nr:PP2C family protein-serine/threonine phosphatase [Pilimelia sp.]